MLIKLWFLGSDRLWVLGLVKGIRVSEFDMVREWKGIERSVDRTGQRRGCYAKISEMNVQVGKW